MPFTHHESMQMQELIKEGDCETVKAGLHGKTLRNKLKYHAWLRIALENKHVDIFRLLIKHGAPVVGYEQNGKDTLLHLAAALDEERIIDYLLEHNMNVIALNKHYETPIHVAAKTRNMHILDILLEHYLENNNEYDNLEDDDGISLFHIICMGQNSENVYKFLKASPHISNIPVSPDSHHWPGYNSLHFAVAYYRCETISLLVKCGLQMESRTSKGIAMLHLACKMDMSDWILKEATPSEDDEQQIQELFENLTAILENREILFTKLLEVFSTSIDIRDDEGNNALMYIINNNCDSGFLYEFLEPKLCILEEVHIEKIKNMLVDKQIQYIQRLLECYNPEYVTYDWDFNTIAVNKTIEEFNLVNNIGLTCLHHLARLSHTQDDVLKFLLKFGADPKKLCIDYYSSLHFAAFGQLSNFIKIILSFEDTNLEKMVNVNAQNRLENTALHYCFLNRNGEKMGNHFYVLMKYGADINIANKDGTTVFPLIHSYIVKTVRHDNFMHAVQLYKDTVLLIYDSNSEIFQIPNLLEILNLVDVRFVAEMWKHFVMLKICNSSNELLCGEFLNEISSILHVNSESKQSSLEFVRLCEQEVMHMKRLHFSKYSCLHDLLTKSINIVALYTDNDQLKRILKSPYFRKMFPIYEKMLKARFIRGLEKKQLLEKATESLKKLIKCTTELDVPQKCYFKILSFLSDATLRDIGDVNYEDKVEEKNI